MDKSNVYMRLIILNKKYSIKLIKDKKMQLPGLKLINSAKKDGRWEQSDPPS